MQITARTDHDLSSEGILRKVSDASGSKYSGDKGPSGSLSDGPPLPVASKPVFTPSRVGGGSTSFAALGSRSRQPTAQADVDEDGWGADAPQVTRSQLEKVEPAYKPTKVNMSELTSQKPPSSRSNGEPSVANERSDIIKGGYQPVGKVDIAAIRREAKDTDKAQDDRPAPVKGSYEPVGKVDIAAIKARTQPSQLHDSAPSSISPAQTGASARSSDSDNQSRSLADRSATFSQSERLSSLPKPKVANKFGSGGGNFAGTKAPTPGAFESRPAPAPSTQVGTASRTFADEGGKTPAQIWAERKARQRGDSGAAQPVRPSPITNQSIGGWESNYGGKKWAPVETTRTGTSATSGGSQDKTAEEPSSPPAGGVSAIRDRFKGTAPMVGGATTNDTTPPMPPPMDMSSKPNAQAMPTLPMHEGEDRAATEMPPPPHPPRTPEPEMSPQDMRSSSPIRIAQPVARTATKEMEAPEERFSPPPMPTRSMAETVPAGEDLEEEAQLAHHDPARGAGEAAATSSFGHAAVQEAAPGATAGGKRAMIQYDYEKAEDNELELREGEYVTNIEMVDDDWWMGQNAHGETGLFPSNYVELIEDEHAGGAHAAAPEPENEPEPEPELAAPTRVATSKSKGQTATAQYDYEAAEGNELSFPDGAKITGVVSVLGFILPCSTVF